jgi:hypothetical protein
MHCYWVIFIVELTIRHRFIGHLSIVILQNSNISMDDMCTWVSRQWEAASCVM